MTHKTTLSIYLLAILFFPGVMIHELGHLFMASILFVPTGEIEFFPKIQEDQVKLGSVAIAKTDIIRRFLIGVAPVLSGVGILLLAAHYLVPLWPLSWRTLVFFYILFEIGNTMFSSKKDMEGALGLFLLIGVITVGFLVLGARLPESVVQWLLNTASSPFFLTLSIWLGLSIILNLFVWGVLTRVTPRGWR